MNNSQLPAKVNWSEESQRLLLEMVRNPQPRKPLVFVLNLTGVDFVQKHEEWMKKAVAAKQNVRKRKKDDQ